MSLCLCVVGLKYQPYDDIKMRNYPSLFRGFLSHFSSQLPHFYDVTGLILVSLRLCVCVFWDIVCSRGSNSSMEGMIYNYFRVSLPSKYKSHLEKNNSSNNLFFFFGGGGASLHTHTQGCSC